MTGGLFTIRRDVGAKFKKPHLYQLFGEATMLAEVLVVANRRAHTHTDASGTLHLF